MMESKQDSLDAFVGKWQVTSTENMKEMLKSFDMDDERRSMYCEMRFVMEYRRDGPDRWSYTVSMNNGNQRTIGYTLGEKFDSETLDGRPIVSQIDEKEGKFVEYHHDKQDPSLSAAMVREIVDGELIVSATVRGITSITRHKRIE